MKYLAIIPARYSSSRFPGKPLADIGGKPMIRRVCEQTAKVFSHVCVATDDPRIHTVVEEFGGNAVMTSANHRSGTDRCAEALEKYSSKYGISFDVVVNVQGDEPFVDPQQLEQLKQCFSDPLTEIATLVTDFESVGEALNINSPKVVTDIQGYALYFSRSRIPFFREERQYPAYLKHVGLYGYRTEILRKITELPASPLEKAENLEQLRWLENGFRIKTAHTLSKTYAIDTPQDIQHLKEIGVISE